MIVELVISCSATIKMLNTFYCRKEILKDFKERKNLQTELLT